MLRLDRFALVCLAALAFPGTLRAQGNLGVWEPSFNHVVPPSWDYMQPNWDNEPQSPYINAADPHRFMAGHMALIPHGPERGKVIVWNFMRAFLGIQHWSIVDPRTQTFQNFGLPVTQSEGDLFCSGHAWTKDGDLLVVGGNRFFGGGVPGANTLAYRIDPTAGMAGNGWWRREPDLFLPRWYPTVTTMGTDGNGRDHLLVTSGWALDPSNPFPELTYESFDPTGAPGFGTWQQNPNLPNNEPVFVGHLLEVFSVYPRTYLLPSGRLFEAGFSERGFRLLHDNIAVGVNPIWEAHATPTSPAPRRNYGSTVLVPNGGDTVMRLGGHFYGAGGGVPSASVDTCQADLAATDPNWVWTPAPSLNAARAYTDATLLPDGTIFVHGGKTDIGSEFDTMMPVYDSEIFDPQAAVPGWRRVAPADVRRGYHSTAVLLPDARVLVGGGEQREMDYQIYRPPYLTNGTARPRFLSPPSTLHMTYGDSYELKFRSDAQIEAAVLMAPGSITHHSGMHQRYVPLDVDVDDDGKLKLAAPSNSNVAPKGFYMLFLVTVPQGPGLTGTPSNAIWVQLS